MNNLNEIRSQIVEADKHYQWHAKVKINGPSAQRILTVIVPSSIIAQEVREWVDRQSFKNNVEVINLL